MQTHMLRQPFSSTIRMHVAMPFAGNRKMIQLEDTMNRPIVVQHNDASAVGLANAYNVHEN